MCYFQYLESSHILGIDISYLYGQLLENCKYFEETFLVILEMLRLYFPAGQPIDCPQSHEEFRQQFGMISKVTLRAAGTSLKQEKDRCSITLLSRVFSLLPSPESIKGSKISLKKESLDFDLALFTTYAQNLKQNMRFVFQSILYRLFKSERLSQISFEDFQKVGQQLAFNKQDSSVIGLVLRSALLRDSLDRPYEGGFQGSIYEEFDIEKGQLDDFLQQAVNFWKNFSFIISILEKNGAIPPQLNTQLNDAKDFLINHLSHIGQNKLAADLGGS